MIMNDNFIKYEFERLNAEELLRNSAAFLEKISKRRSVRSFSDEDIPEEVIVNIIKAAATAPSGANKQPWFFYLVRDKEIKRKIKEEAECVEQENYSKRFSPQMKEDLKKINTDANKPFLEEAPYLIVVCKEKYRLEDGKKKKNYYVNESVGIALGFLIAAIHFSGLFTVTYTPNPMTFLKHILDMPENITPIAILPVGYPKTDTKVNSLPQKNTNKILKVL